MRVTLPHPAFIMVPGDLLAHEFPQTYATVTHDNDREHYRAFVLKTLSFLALGIPQAIRGHKDPGHARQ